MEKTLIVRVYPEKYGYTDVEFRQEHGVFVVSGSTTYNSFSLDLSDELLCKATDEARDWLESLGLKVEKHRNRDIPE